MAAVTRMGRGWTWLALLACALTLFTPASAGATTRKHTVAHHCHAHHKHSRKCRPAAQHKTRKHKTHKRSPKPPAAVPASDVPSTPISQPVPPSPPAASQESLPLPPVTGVGNAPGCLDGADPRPAMQLYPGATVLRIILSAYDWWSSPLAAGDGTDGSALPCVQAAIRQGYKVMISLQWDNQWTPQQTAAWFQQELAIYGPYLWAIGVGNEQEIGYQDGYQGGSRDPNGEASAYAANWNAVLPVILQDAPQALRVAGVGPWSLAYDTDILQIGLEDVQALGMNMYYIPVPQVLQLADAYHIQLWITEGLAGADSWGASEPLDFYRGAQVALAWLN
jgi:hypothetical protein